MTPEAAATGAGREATAGSRPIRVVVMASVRWYNASAAYAVELARGLTERGAVVRMIVQPDGPVEKEARARGLSVETSVDLTGTRPREIAASLRFLRRFFREFRPDVVNPHRGEDHILAALALRGTGIPLVRTRGDIRPPRSHLANRFLYRRLTAAHVACADFMRERFYPRLGIPASTVSIIRPGMDVASFRQGVPDPARARQRLRLTPNVPWLGLIGRFTAVKGHRVLIRALARVRHEPAPHLLLSGTPNEISADNLREEAERAGVASRVRVTGRLSDARVGLRALDALVVPSVGSEAISRIALEGLSLGVPVVASRVNSLPEIVGDAGVLVPPGDAEELALALERLLADETLRRAVAERGPERILRRYDRTVQLDLTEALFHSVRGERVTR